MSDMDVLLRFSRVPEAQFWNSPSVRSSLLRADRAGVWVALVNNSLFVYILLALGKEASAVLPLQMTFFACLLFAQLAAQRCASLPPRAAYFPLYAFSPLFSGAGLRRRSCHRCLRRRLLQRRRRPCRRHRSLLPPAPHARTHVRTHAPPAG